MGKRFRYWFVNVFWYHYRAAALITVAAVFLLVVLIADYVNRDEPDLIYIMLSDDLYVDSLTGELLDPYFRPVLQSVTGDGEAFSQCEGLWLAPQNENAYIAAQKLALSFMNDSYSLYIIFESSLPHLLDGESAASAFMPLDNLGYPTHPEADWLADASDCQIWRDIGLEEKTGIYLAVRTVPPEAKADIAAARQNALNVLRLLFSPKGGDGNGA